MTEKRKVGRLRYTFRKWRAKRHMERGVHYLQQDGETIDERYKQLQQRLLTNTTTNTT